MHLRQVLIVAVVSIAVCSAAIVSIASENLTGSWDAGFTINVQSPAITVFHSQVTEVYRLDQLTLEGTALWKYEAGQLEFDSLWFEGRYPLGGIIDLQSRLAFDPTASNILDIFDYWRTTVSFTLLNIDFVNTFYLTRPQTASYEQLTARGSIGDVSYSNLLRFDMDETGGFCFDKEALSLSWTWCDMKMSAAIDFTQSGFGSFTLTEKGYAIPKLSQDGYGLFLNLSLSFTTDTKNITPSISLKTPWIDCIRLLSELDTGSGTLSIDGINVYGVVFDYTYSDGIRIKSATSFDSAKNSSVTGQSDYFELFLLSGRTEPCCGGPGRWSVATYFSRSSTQLFDWGMTLFKLNFDLSDQLSTETQIAIRSGEFGDPQLELVLGWTARW